MHTTMAAFLAVVFVSGCATQPPQMLRWSKPGATQTDFMLAPLTGSDHGNGLNCWMKAVFLEGLRRLEAQFRHRNAHFNARSNTARASWRMLMSLIPASKMTR